MRGNAKGEYFVEDASIFWTSPLLSKCEENSTFGATQLCLALKCFHTKHGRLPDNLNELVPEFLPAIPLDDYNGKPLKYSRERRLIWSVGEDLIDSGGVNSEKTGGPKDDILFDIELKPAP